jgi:small nuclear ribonucleoprotein (snRNP)-like protein
MFPNFFLKNSKNKKILIEIKNGDNINGIIYNIDNFMNIHIKNGIITKKDGKNFFKMSDIYIRGSNINSINFDEKVYEEIVKKKEEKEKNEENIKKIEDENEIEINNIRKTKTLDKKNSNKLMLNNEKKIRKMSNFFSPQKARKKSITEK